MDDWIVTAPSRWKLRSVVRIVNQTLYMLRAKKHPDKTYICKVNSGFNFPGYFLQPGIIRVAVDTIKRFAVHITRLYEQGADSFRIGEYVRHWLMRVSAGVILQSMAKKIGGYREEIPPAPQYCSARYLNCYYY